MVLERAAGGVTTVLRDAIMPETPAPEGHTAAIALRLRRGGATDLRASDHHVWINGYHLWISGRAPSGMLFQLFHWSPQGYCVTRRPLNDQPVESLGVFPTWTEAVDQALRA